jgi:hypothetical protein
MASSINDLIPIADTDILAEPIKANFVAAKSEIEALQTGKVDIEVGKGLSSNDYTTVEKNKLAGISVGAEVNAVDSVAGRTGDVLLTKSDVGLANVDNTSDLNKPISTATQTALNLKANLASPTFTGTVAGITKSMVGLSNVDNTSDINKPISSATQTALDGKQPLATVLTNTTASFTTALETKLNGVAIGATANSTDAQLRDRTTHTGTQLSSTISDFNSATRAQVEAELIAGANITITPSGAGATRTLTIASSGVGGGGPSTAWGEITGTLSDQTDLQNALNAKEPTITAGTTAQYYRGDKTFQALNTTAVAEGSNLYHTVARVLASAITGLSTATNSAVVATDTILQAIGKLQAQVTARASLAVSNVFTALNRFTQTTCPFTTITWSASIAADLSQGQAFVVTATGATTLIAPTNADGSNFQSFQLEFIQDATGSRTLGFNTTAYESAGATFPTVTATANAKTVLLFNRQSNGKYLVSALLNARSA